VFIDPGDTALVTDPGYPVYEAAIGFAGGAPVRIPLEEQRGFLPDLSSIPDHVASSAKFIFVNYPNNPTAAVADQSFFENLVDFSKKHDLVILADNAYSEVYFEPADKPISIMQIPGAKDISIEIHSFSKTFNMTGWRIGFIVGSKALIDAALTLKSNFDSGVFMAIQRAAARALGHPDAPLFNESRTQLFKLRREIISSALKEMGFRFKLPRASYYFWVHIPENYSSSVAFCADLLENQGLIVTPGIGYGPSGEAYFRISMTADDSKIKQAMERLKYFVKGL
jgi:LL-diaminopimelate aminotransferase